MSKMLLHVVWMLANIKGCRTFCDRAEDSGLCTEERTVHVMNGEATPLFCLWTCLFPSSKCPPS